MNSNLGNKQGGVVLIIVLIMLGIFSVIVSSMLTSSNINFKIAGNQQYRVEAKLAARNALETYISNPANFSLPLPTANSNIESDFDGNGVIDMVGVVPPPNCLRIAPILRSELSYPKDKDCIRTAQDVDDNIFRDNEGIASVTNSGCVKMTWDVQANVVDTVTGVNLEMHQGVYVRAALGTTCL